MDIEQEFDKLSDDIRKDFIVILSLAFDDDSPLQHDTMPSYILLILDILKNMDNGNISFKNDKSKHTILTILSVLLKLDPHTEGYAMNKQKPTGVAH